MALEGEIVRGASQSTGLDLQVPPVFRKGLGLIFALAIGWLVWDLTPAAPMDANGVHFLAVLGAAIFLWALDVFDEYIVALMLLLSWVILGIVPSKVALAGFSESSWFFVVAALGIGAAINKTGVLYRLCLHAMSRIPPRYHRTYSLFLLVSGVAATPLLPTGKARAVIAVPVTQVISEAVGFKHRSNGSAALALSALVGYSQMSFMFLTGGEFCLIGWNLLPPTSKSEFGWLVWFLAALPAGVLILLVVFLFTRFLFPLESHGEAEISNRALQARLETLGPLGHAEWIGMTVLALTLAGWLTMPFHGINEAWIALAALLAFLMTGILDRETFKNRIDWGLILFFGIVTSIAAVSTHLKVDRWLVGLIAPLVTGLSSSPLAFLGAVSLLVCFARLFLRKSAVVAFFTLTLVPLAHGIGIHPGVLLLTIVMASECFLLPYQDGPYQIAYSAGNGLAFSHAQGRKVLLVKYIGTFLAIAVSIPYWRILGLVGG